MLRLNPSTLSQALGQQLLDNGSHIKSIFEEILWPIISTRLLDPTLQRSNSGSINQGSAISLFLASYNRAPKIIAEVGTYIGSSAASIGCGAGLNQQPVQLITCDVNPCTDKPFSGLNMPKGSQAHVIQGTSTQMFKKLAIKKVKLDMLHLDGYLKPSDTNILQKILKDDTLIALDDCERGEKGHINLDLMRREGLILGHVFVEPFPRDLFKRWGLETRSSTGLLVPRSLIEFTRQ